MALSPDEDPGLVAFADPRTQRALESMLSSRVGDVGVQAFERVYARTAGTEAPAGSGTAVKPVPSAYHLRWRGLVNRRVWLDDDVLTKADISADGGADRGAVSGRLSDRALSAQQGLRARNQMAARQT